MRPLSSSTDEAAVQLRSERMVPLSAFEPTHHEHSFPALLSIERFQATQSERVADRKPMCVFCRRLIREPTGRSQHGHSSTPLIPLRILVRMSALARARLPNYVAILWLLPVFLLPAQPGAPASLGPRGHDTSSHFFVCSSDQIAARSIGRSTIGRHRSLHTNPLSVDVLLLVGRSTIARSIRSLALSVRSLQYHSLVRSRCYPHAMPLLANLPPALPPITLVPIALPHQSLYGRSVKLFILATARSDRARSRALPLAPLLQVSLPPL
jgi:hypothetical protein